jgi:NAD(P)-dependent dehydrogenase (short-subunit alcohol dehydrogenase family)
MCIRTTSLLCIGLLLPLSVQAWSTGGGGSSSDRRGFLIQTAGKAAVAVGTASIGLNEVIGVENAQAATSVYQPSPGSLAGQVHVITGANTGLGLESAKRLAAADATVVMTARSDAKGDKAKGQVLDYLKERSINNKEIYSLTLDLSDFESVKSFPERYEKMLGSRKIDVLMNNAGAINKDFELSKNGIERTFQSNHLGPFLLTSSLFPYLNHDGARVINVSSYAHEVIPKVHKTGKPGLDMNNLNSEISYASDGWEAYGQTKLENVFFTEELQCRADAAGLDWLTTVALHPGLVGTDIWRSTPVAKGSSGIKALSSMLFYNNVLTTEEGANTQVKLASEKNIAKGRYYDENGRLKELAPFARDSSKARELWDVSEKLTGCVFNVQ